MRHGEAESRAQSPDKTDENRRLTDQGSKNIRNVSEFAKKLGTEPNLFISSPLTRAKQSAEIAKEILNTGAELRTENCLEPEGETTDVYETLAKLNDIESVMLVSHLPLVELLVRDLLGWQNERKNLVLSPSALIRMDSKTKPGSASGDLIWMLPQI